MPNLPTRNNQRRGSVLMGAAGGGSNSSTLIQPLNSLPSIKISSEENI
jgi:hypothetical protein